MTDEKKKDNINIPDDIEELLDELLDMEEKVAEEAEGEPSEVMALPMIPLRGLHIFPNMVLHFDVGREKSVKALETAMVTNQKIFLTSQKDEDVELPVKDDYYSIGVVAKIKQMLKLQGDTIRVLVEGLYRAEIGEILQESPYIKCTLEDVEEIIPEEITPQILALKRSVETAFDEYAELTHKLNGETLGTVKEIDDLSTFADIVASHLDIKIEEKQELLEMLDVCERLNKLYEVLIREIEIMKIEQDISAKVKSQVNQNQKEYYLREQMRAIQNELGIDEDVENEQNEWLKKLEELHLPEKTHQKIEKEIKRFTKMQPMSAESTVSRTYIETILALPWNKSSESEVDLKRAEEILEEDHYGLEKVKDRILEYIAVMKLTESLKGPILCLVGPPGVGKTSIARSIARSLNREFFRMSLGGVRDEAEIRGHRRTYIGAIPGRVISGLKDAGTNNPVFLFDEVDKIGADYKGDPASALLEVLDPEQNKDYTDHYLEVPFDLSKVMFITTANTVETIPRPLLDRMEIIEVSGYTEEEKLAIADRYLIPKKVKEHGLKEENITITEGAVRDLINYYTRESGVRNLEREIANLCRKTARKMVSGEAESFEITSENLSDYLGKKKYRYDIIKGETEVGVTTGLAWTIVGGDTLFIETTVVPGTGKLVLTGQLGEVMQESAKAGISYIRSIAGELGIKEDFYKTQDLHIHIPEGATPKDGPSAGVTMCTAMISTLTNTPVRKDIAMTGEITLRGKVLPVGGIKEKILAAKRAGIKEKVLAAHRAGIRKVLLPADNKADIDDIPEKVRNEIEFVLISNAKEALDQVLVR